MARPPIVEITSEFIEIATVFEEDKEKEHTINNRYQVVFYQGQPVWLDFAAAIYPHLSVCYSVKTQVFLSSPNFQYPVGKLSIIINYYRHFNYATEKTKQRSKNEKTTAKSQQ